MILVAGRQAGGIEFGAQLAPFSHGGAEGIEWLETRIGDEADAGVACIADDGDLLIEGQLTHGPGAEGETHSLQA